MTHTRAIERTYVLAAFLSAVVAAGVLATALHAAQVSPTTWITPAKQTTPTDPRPSAAPSADGEHFGSITAAYVGPPELVFEAVSLPVAGDVVVTRVDCSGEGCVEGAPTTYDEFTRSFDAAADASRPDTRLFRVTVAGGYVVGIDEQHRS